MNKQTKMILGVLALGIAGFFIYNSMKPKTASFVRNMPKPRRPKPRTKPRMPKPKPASDGYYSTPRVMPKNLMPKPKPTTSTSPVGYGNAYVETSTIGYGEPTPYYGGTIGTTPVYQSY